MFVICMILFVTVAAYDSYAVHKGWRKEWRK
jgi:hypothetical protein